jgi:hypothetical protein
MKIINRFQVRFLRNVQALGRRRRTVKVETLNILQLDRGYCRIRSDRPYVERGEDSRD